MTKLDVFDKISYSTASSRLPYARGQTKETADLGSFGLGRLYTQGKSLESRGLSVY